MNYGSAVGLVEIFFFFLHVVIGLEFCAVSGGATASTPLGGHATVGEAVAGCLSRMPCPLHPDVLLGYPPCAPLPKSCTGSGQAMDNEISPPSAFTVRSPRRTHCDGGDGGRGSGSLRCGVR